MAWIDQCIAESRPCKGGESFDFKFRRTVPANRNGLLAIVRSKQL